MDIERLLELSGIPLMESKAKNINDILKFFEISEEDNTHQYYELMKKYEGEYMRGELTAIGVARDSKVKTYQVYGEMGNEIDMNVTLRELLNNTKIFKVKRIQVL